MFALKQDLNPRKRPQGIRFPKKNVRNGGMKVISNQVLQNTIDGLKSITQTDLCIFDTEGKILADTREQSPDLGDTVRTFAASEENTLSKDGNFFCKIFEEYQLEYILLSTDNGGNAQLVGKVTAFQLESLLLAYQERLDKDNFFKNLLLDNLLLVDIYNRAKKLHIDAEARRIVYIVEMPPGSEANLLERVRTLIHDRNKEFATVVDEKNVILIKEVADNVPYRELEEYARELLAVLSGEEEGFRIALGAVVSDIKEISKSYKEAKIALDVGEIFFPGKDIVTYNTLGIGRLIYQLPVPLCKMFIKEIFEKKSPEDFDDEMIATINKFFENSLNVSETSRQLYIHRNTLVYRLDKIQKLTGLDLRVFEDAITFKIALMVVRYMAALEH